MTAVRIVTEHDELENIGEVTHQELDQHVNLTPFLIVSGANGPIPPSARILNAGPGVTIEDAGPGAEITISVEPSSDGFLPQEKESSSITLVPDKKTMLVFGEFVLHGDASLHLSGSASLVGIG